MDDTQIVDWLEKNGEEIYTARIDKADYLVLQWNDRDGESRLTYGCDLRDAVRGALAGECMPGQKLWMASAGDAP